MNRFSWVQDFAARLANLGAPVSADVLLTLAHERYEMRGKDGVTPQSAYCRANIITLGGKFAW